MIFDDGDVPMKNWRIKDAPNDQNGDAHESVVHNVAGKNSNDNIPFPQQTIYKSVPNYVTDDSLNVSMYILVILTLAVLILFLNCYRKSRRKYALLNKLGL